MPDYYPRHLPLEIFFILSNAKHCAQHPQIIHKTWRCSVYHIGHEKGKLEGEVITTVENDLELLCRMAQQNVTYDLMCSLSDVPKSLLVAFCRAHSVERARTLLEQIRQVHAYSGMEATRLGLSEALTCFGTPAKVVDSYLNTINYK